MQWYNQPLKSGTRAKEIEMVFEFQSWGRRLNMAKGQTRVQAVTTLGGVPPSVGEKHTEEILE